jgi:Putative phage metallopeptidase
LLICVIIKKIVEGVLIKMRFEDASDTAYEIMMKLREDHFPELSGCRIKIVFDLKKRMSGTKIVLGSIQKPNEIVRFFSIPESGSDEGYDYIMRIDKKAWNLSSDEDKKRLIRHELRHTLVDTDSVTNPYKTRGHTIEDFYSEIRLNEDDPRWAERIGLSTLSAYEQERAR